jgi:hypothetical protein
MGLQVKLIELRDIATCIPVLAVRLWRDREADPESHWLLARAGYGSLESVSPPCVLLTDLQGGRKAEYDPYAWGGRTFPVAHDYIQDNWDLIPDGGIVDVRVILGEETELPKSDRGDWT